MQRVVVAGLIAKNPRVMAGCDVIGTDLLSKVPELSKLQPVVALNARIWCASRQVLISEVIFDSCERVLKIQ